MCLHEFVLGCLAVFFLLQLFNQPNIATNKTIQHKLMRLKESSYFFISILSDSYNAELYGGSR